MGYTKTIACLANSRKPPSGGRCVAGREVTPSGFGAWIRPVSVRPTQEISEEERRYQDGTDPQVLDVIAIQLASAQPQLHQKENPHRRRVLLAEAAHHFMARTTGSR